ncbi:hypothetical protein QAD02_001911 [Eretmocerus hayati]|uniref:Uncharacterized protein n=1 Tax=Eretmocerus hayati TaxID=131215 RepID=A0ACC2NHT1_9HYME|nr:hypothetical protein QAD02_001911 [Eretmocerus hayati]
MSAEMEGMSQLDCLLEKHKQLQERSAIKSPYQSSAKQNDVNSMNHQHEDVAYNASEKVAAAGPGRVYLNPHYAPRKPSIHVNPKLLMQNVPSPITPQMMSVDYTLVNQNFIHPSQQIENYVDLDPRMMMPFTPPVFEYNDMFPYEPEICLPLQQPTVPAVKTSSKQPSYVSNSRHNLADLVSIPLQKLPAVTAKACDQVELAVCSTSPPIEVINIDSSDEADQILDNEIATKDTQDSNLIALSRRKLVRMRKISKSSATSCPSKFPTPFKRRFSSSGSKKMKPNSKSVVSRAISQSENEELVKLCDNSSKDQTSLPSESENIVSATDNDKKSKNLGKTTNLVSIDGVMYRSSRNRLIRSSPCLPPTKRKRSLLSSKSIHYFITQNGKKLQKVESPTIISCDCPSLNSSTVSDKSTKSSASYKVKRKSLQNVRNRTGRNNQPCLLFQRFGHCANQLRGTCSKVHDRNQVALCRNFLQGRCFLKNCPLSHNIGPEKMPTCKYFLEGCCSRDACPYLHVKVPSKNPICSNFLRGYCPQGNECLNRHIRACPEFDKNGKCSKGKSCPYPHKLPLTDKKRFEGGKQLKNETFGKKKSRKKNIPGETAKRYYEKADEDLSKKREKLLQSVAHIKDMHLSHSLSCQGKSSSEGSNAMRNTKEIPRDTERLKAVCNKSRPPLGPLPAYIPID